MDRGEGFEDFGEGAGDVGQGDPAVAVVDAGDLEQRGEGPGFGGDSG